jgi:hypothetical protein
MSNAREPRARSHSHTSRPDEELISRANTVTDRRRPAGSSRRITAIIGGILIIGATCWLGWLLLRQFNSSPGITTSSLSSNGPGASPTVALSSLAAAGISLGHPLQTPALNQQQALLLAAALEPVAATQAKKVSSEYVSLNYADKSSAHSNLSDVPAWLIIYQHIPIASHDPSVDSTPSAQAYQDLYVFLDANSGKELLAIWL